MRIAIAALCSAGLLADTAVASTDMMMGTWARGDGQALVKIDRCGDAFCAVNTWIRDPSGGEKVGDRLVMTVRPKAEGKLSGTAFDPQRNLSFRIDISVAEQSMKTRGCVLAGILCKSVAWTKQ